MEQAKGYILEHLQPSKTDPTHFEFVVELCEQHSDLIRVRFSSRHSTQKHYIATVQFDNYDRGTYSRMVLHLPYRCKGT